MNRSDFQALAEIRVREAKKLLAAKCFEGAYYLLGYAVEFALKSCIAKQTKRYDFPDKNFASSVYVHDLNKLLKASNLEQKFQKDVKNNATLEINWAIVKDWSEQKRYSAGVSEQEAIDFHSAVLSKSNGVLTWLQKRW
ncbi:MAG: DNA-binding protein [Pyrinomonadaceae bacterium]